MLQNNEYSAKHCIVAGGSAGLGLSLAIALAARGANITIFARRPVQLEDAIAKIREHASGEEQRILGIPVDCTDCPALRIAINNSISRHEGAAPVALFCCVGASKPLGFLELTDSDFESQMKVNYLSAVYCVRAALPGMLKLKASEKCHIVLVSSVAGVLGFAGYAAYAPTKAALKCLGDCLRNELVGTNVNVHVFLPASFSSPGYDDEMKIKPELTRQIEASDPVISADECASRLLRGMKNDQFLITTSTTGDLVRCAGLVHSPPNNTILDFFKLIIAFIGLNLWRRTELDPLALKYPTIFHSSSRKQSKKNGMMI